MCMVCVIETDIFGQSGRGEGEMYVWSCVVREEGMYMSLCICEVRVCCVQEKVWPPHIALEEGMLPVIKQQQHCVSGRSVLFNLHNQDQQDMGDFQA